MSRVGTPSTVAWPSTRSRIEAATASMSSWVAASKEFKRPVSVMMRSAAESSVVAVAISPLSGVVGSTAVFGVVLSIREC